MNTVIRAIAVLLLLAPQSSTMIDSPQLLADIKTLSADDMQGRQVETPGGEKARRFVAQRFRESGVVPFGGDYFVPFTFNSGRGANSQERHGVNVIGHIDGLRSSEPRRYIVVSAHYDHLGVIRGQIFNGADDNASGTAALFAIARYFSAHRPEHSLIFAAFDAEEVGLEGSKAFVARPPVNKSQLALDITADMIARDDTLFVVGTFLQPFLKPGVERIIAHAPAKTVIGHDDPGQKKIEDWTRDSDHYSFIEAKIPALFFGVEDYSQHHKATDRFESIDPVFYVHSVETVIDAVREFDGSLEGGH